MTKKIFTFLTLFILAFTFNSCEEEIETSELKYASFEKDNLNVGVADSGQSTAEFNIFTTNTTSSDRVFDIQVTEGSTASPDFYTVPATVTVPGGTNKGVISVSLTDGTWLDSDHSLGLRLSSANDSQYVGTDLNLIIYRLCPGATETKVKFDISFDKYPEEVAWRILNASGDTVMASATPFNFGGYPAGTTGSTYVGFCLTSGTYTFEIFDQYSDGAGAFSLSTYDGITLVSSDGKYDGSLTAEFTL